LKYKFEANHNKDYSVVKTSKAGQLAFFIFWLSIFAYSILETIKQTFPKLFTAASELWKS
jgi:hypothetical protein